MSSFQFQVGDKVKIVNTPLTGTIARVDTGDPDVPYLIAMDNGRESWYCTSEVEAATPEPSVRAIAILTVFSDGTTTTKHL